MEEATVEVTVGTVNTSIKQLIVSVVKHANGEQQVRLFINPKSGRGSGELITLNLDHYEKMKQALLAADTEIAQVTGQGIKCPNCKTPQKNEPGKACAFCGFVRT